MASAPQNKKPRRPPATTVEGRENQLINMAYDHAEKSFLEGNASSQVTVHFLKMGTARENLEREKLRKEILLQEARAKELESGGRLEEITENALKAFRTYSGSVEMPDD